MKIETICEGVYRIWFGWSNAYVLTEADRATLVDTGRCIDREDLLRALDEIGVDRRNVTDVILTHGHCDHAGNAAFLAEGMSAAPGSPPLRPTVTIHEVEAPYVTGEVPTYAARGLRRLWRPGMSAVMLRAERRFPVERFRPDVTVAEGDAIDAPGGPFRVLFTPGHAPGHLSLLRERDGILFTGDTIMNVDLKGRIGLCLPIPMFCEDYGAAKRSARKLADLDVTMVLSGHGPPVTENAANQLLDLAVSLS